MPKNEAHSSVNNEPQDIFNIIKRATDEVAVEKACRLIDSYVLAVWQELPPSPASQYDTAAPSVGSAKS